ncbi:hypothetical protein BH23GEM3_BH23GEM3_15630 [soil metagenome]|nr:hypothetical protein [Gemmatimonadota bacterium]MBA4156939.1 hypothetical protein [Gemmatimonadota bacterium]
MKAKLEVAANILFVTTILAVIAIVGKDHVFSSPSGASSQLRVGDIMAPLEGHSWDGQGETLVLAFQNSCEYCKASIPFYRRLVDLQERATVSTRMLALFSDPGSVVSDLLEKQQWRVDSHHSVNLSELGVQETPALVLIDRNGRVLYIWRGRLSPQEETHLVEMLKAMAAKAPLVPLPPA